MVKQYFYKQAYLSNTEIILYKDGKTVGRDIVNDYELEGYIRRSESEGYTYCYPPEELITLEQEYESAKEVYLNALNCDKLYGT